MHVGVGIGGIGHGKGLSAYRPKLVNEISNFTDFFLTSLISFVIVTAKLVGGEGR